MQKPIFCISLVHYDILSPLLLNFYVLNLNQTLLWKTGHGGRLRDDNGDEEDGYDETLVPLDYEEAGQIRDDDLFKILVHPMPEGVTVTCVMDCCHSGTVLDLPYKYIAGESDGMEYDESYNENKFDDLLDAAGGMMAAAVVADAVVSECCVVQ